MRFTAQARRIAGLVAVGVCLLATGPAAAQGARLEAAGFQDEPVITGLEEPSNFRFAPDGRIFVAEKTGKILVFDNIDDKTPTLFADLRTQAYDTGDRGILGLALDPSFPAKPYVYVLYTYDHILGDPEPAPKWGEPNTTGDPCPEPNPEACEVSGRLVRLTASGDHAVEANGSPLEDVLVEGWCQQYSSHSIGDLQFGPEGALYASGGDGASFSHVDHGQLGEPENPCGDPPNEGGALRAQDVRTPADPTGLNGSVIRIDPETGKGLPGNPMAASADENARRIVAFGFRNPFALSSTRPPTSCTSAMLAGTPGRKSIASTPPRARPTTRAGPVTRARNASPSMKEPISGFAKVSTPNPAPPRSPSSRIGIAKGSRRATHAWISGARRFPASPSTERGPTRRPTTAPCFSPIPCVAAST